MAAQEYSGAEVRQTTVAPDSRHFDRHMQILGKGLTS